MSWQYSLESTISDISHCFPWIAGDRRHVFLKQFYNKFRVEKQCWIMSHEHVILKKVLKFNMATKT